MQFVVIAHDATDDEALNRRMAVRDAHMEGVRVLQKNGQILFGGAVLDDNEKMIGSVAIYEFPSREALDACLAADPYVTGKVWQKIEVQQYRVAPPFVGLKPAVAV